MKTIRQSQFEVNSSSTHSFSLDLSYTNKQSVKDVNVEAGTFGWDYKSFNDFKTKASYFWTLVHDENDHPLFKRLRRLSSKYKFNLLYPRKDDFVYVDHDTKHYNDWIRHSPTLNTDEGLMEFMMSESGWIFLGNDNNGGPPNFRLTPNQIKDMPYILTLLEDPAYTYALPDNEAFTVEQCVDIIAAYQYLNKIGSDRYNYVRIISVDDGVIHACLEKYDYKKKCNMITDEYSLHYTVKQNHVI